VLLPPPPSPPGSAPAVVLAAGARGGGGGGLVWVASPSAPSVPDGAGIVNNVVHVVAPPGGAALLEGEDADD